jgi:hypothetical protein
MEVIAHVDPHGDLNGNVYGHGRHAYLGSYGSSRTRCVGTGIRIYDLKNPARPKLVSSFARAQSHPELLGTYTDQVRVQTARTPYFRGVLAAVGVQRCRDPFVGPGSLQGFAVYDVTKPSRPRLMSIVNTRPAHGSHELWLEAAGGRAFVYTALSRSEHHTTPDGVTPGKPDFRIFEVTNPRTPTLVGQWGIWNNLGRHPANDEFVHSVRTNANATRAYVSYWDFGTAILDISDPARTRLIGHTVLLPDSHAHTAALAHGDRVLVETPEYGHFFNMRGPGYPRFWDISNPANPVLLSTFAPPGTEASTVHDPSVLGNRAYFSWYDHGVWVLDISEPRTPVELAHFVPPAKVDLENTACPTCPFVWGVSAHRDYLLASDMNSGLWVLKLRCEMPDVRGLRLGAARAALLRADCGRPRVTRQRRAGMRGRVIRQSPAPATRPRYPARVRLVVG